MTILITGGAGYIGSHCARYLWEERDDAIVILDNLSTGHRALTLGAEFALGDTRDLDFVVDTLRRYKVTAVMHFAASAYVGESVQHPGKYYHNNVMGTWTLLEAMRAVGVKDFIFSSTCATYGNPQYMPLDENHPQNPINPYGQTKLVVEKMLADYGPAYDLRSVCLRYFNAAGADPQGRIGEAHDPETHLIPLVLQAIKGDRPHITVFGEDYDTPDGTCIRDYIHIDDIAQAHVLALDYLRKGGQSDAFNIGTETGFSVKEVIATCEQVTGKQCPIEMGQRRPGDPAKLVAKADKIKSTLGWEAKYKELATTVETAWRWEQQKTAVLKAGALSS